MDNLKISLDELTSEHIREIAKREGLTPSQVIEDGVGLKATEVYAREHGYRMFMVDEAGGLIHEITPCERHKKEHEPQRLTPETQPRKGKTGTARLLLNYLRALYQ